MGPTLSFRFASHRCYILNLFLFHCGVNMGRGKKKRYCVCVSVYWYAANNSTAVSEYSLDSQRKHKIKQQLTANCFLNIVLFKASTYLPVALAVFTSCAIVAGTSLRLHVSVFGT